MQIFLYLVLPPQKIFYDEINYSKGYFIRSAHIFNLNQKCYILLIQLKNENVIYDIDADKNVSDDIDASKIVGVLTSQNILYIQCEDYILHLRLINEKFKIKKKCHSTNQTYNIKNFLINKSHDIVLEQKNSIIRLKSLEFQKQIFRIQENEQSKMNFIFNKGFVIYRNRQDGQQFLNIMNLRDRQIIIRQLMFNIFQIVVVQNTENILIQIGDQGLYLYKIIYSDKIIQQLKILNLNVETICLFDDNNLLNLITPKSFIKFDKFYNMIQRYNINYEQENQYLVKSLDLVKIKHGLPQLFSFQTITTLPTFKIYKQTQAEKQQSNYLQFSECNNFQIEYQFNIGRQQHLISNDQHHLTFIIGKSLMFYGIRNGVYVYLHFNNIIRHLNFSNNSNSLYVTIQNRILCYKTKQNLKKSHSYNLTIEQLRTNKQIMLAINDSGQAIAINKATKKRIFKLKTIQFYRSFDYESSNGTILVSREEQVTLFNLADRKLIIKYAIENKQCKMIDNSHNLFILTNKKQLQLWSYADQFQLVQEKVIQGKVRIILQGFKEYFCLRLINQIIIMNQQFQIVEQLEFKTIQRDIDPDYNSDSISQDDQIVQQNYIVKISIYPQTEIQGDDESYENIVLSLERRQIIK